MVQAWRGMIGFGAKLVVRHAQHIGPGSFIAIIASDPMPLLLLCVRR